MSESASGYAVSVEDHDNVRVLVLDRPAKLNAFTAEGYRALKAALDTAAADDPDVAVCVLTGRGRAFSAGVDLDEMSRPGGSAELGVDFDPLLDCLARIPEAAGGGRQRAGGGVRRDAAPALRSRGRGRRERRDPHALHRPGHVRRGGQQLAPARTRRPAAGIVDDALGLAAQRRRMPSPPGSRCRAPRPATPSTTALTLARALAAAQRRRPGGEQGPAARRVHGRRIAEVWQREKAAMAAMAQKLGPIGWSAPGA